MVHLLSSAPVIVERRILGVNRAYWTCRADEEDLGGFMALFGVRAALRIEVSLYLEVARGCALSLVIVRSRLTLPNNVRPNCVRRMKYR